MIRIAVFPGSFDPFTIGHESIVRRALPMFDKIIVAIGHNTAKKGFFSIEKRVNWLNEVFAQTPEVEVAVYEGLTVDFCQHVNAQFILRGLRTSTDFEYERAIAQMNRAMSTDIETVYILTLPEHTAISSTIVRDIIRYRGNAAQFLPQAIHISPEDVE